MDYEEFLWAMGEEPLAQAIRAGYAARRPLPEVYRQAAGGEHRLAPKPAEPGRRRPEVAALHGPLPVGGRARRNDLSSSQTPKIGRLVPARASSCSAPTGSLPPEGGRLPDVAKLRRPIFGVRACEPANGHCRGGGRRFCAYGFAASSEKAAAAVRARGARGVRHGRGNSSRRLRA